MEKLESRLFYTPEEFRRDILRCSRGLPPIVIPLVKSLPHLE